MPNTFTPRVLTEMMKDRAETVRDFQSEDDASYVADWQGFLLMLNDDAYDEFMEKYRDTGELPDIDELRES